MRDYRDSYPAALAKGTVLGGQYILEDVLGQGGFGITYKAQDYQTKEYVAIKEFLPDGLAFRTDGKTVTASNSQRMNDFSYGQECFLNEARTLAEFIGNPNVVKVYNYFTENGTAYFVMEYVAGRSFKDYIKNNGGKVSYIDAIKYLYPVMDALTSAHNMGIIHRDVTPDNICIMPDGAVKLLDFGAARYSMGDRSRSLDVVLKHGYAPKEQYTRRGRQGPYTDVYSLAACYYAAITGRIPPDSIDRIDENNLDNLISPSSMGEQLPECMEYAILKGLAVQPADRFQSIEEFKQALLGNGQEPIDQKQTDQKTIDLETTDQKQTDQKQTNQKPKEIVKKCFIIMIKACFMRILLMIGVGVVVTPVVLLYSVYSANNRSVEDLSAEEYFDKGYAAAQREEWTEAVKWYQKAADLGYASAMNSLGMRYKNGEGVAQNINKAVKWYQEAADLGNMYAMYNLGVCYENGDGVPQNIYKAVEWYQEAADLGDEDAMNNLGWCYKNGEGVAQNINKAVEWYKKAADLGNMYAMYNLGVCYENGEGVTKNINKAAELYRKAADLGYEDAAERLSALE